MDLNKTAPHYITNDSALQVERDILIEIIDNQGMDI
jgi:hypothetical protein